MCLEIQLYHISAILPAPTGAHGEWRINIQARPAALIGERDVVSAASL